MQKFVNGGDGNMSALCSKPTDRHCNVHAVGEVGEPHFARGDGGKAGGKAVGTGEEQESVSELGKSEGVGKRQELDLCPKDGGERVGEVRELGRDDGRVLLRGKGERAFVDDLCKVSGQAREVIKDVRGEKVNHKLGAFTEVSAGGNGVSERFAGFIATGLA
jgi:hypothetical protein